MAGINYVIWKGPPWEVEHVDPTQLSEEKLASLQQSFQRDLEAEERQEATDRQTEAWEEGRPYPGLV